MPRKLSGRLTFFMVLVSGLSILFAGFFIDRALDRQFSQFLATSQEKRNLQLVQAVKELYEGSDAETVRRQLEILSSAAAVEITIVPPTRMHGRQMAGHMMGRGPGHMRRQTTEEITLPGGEEAVINITPLLSAEALVDEAAFRTAVNKSIFLAALLSLGAALAVSAFFSWGLTRPLNQLLTVVRRVGQGDLEQKVEIKGSDEISFLGREFNEMARNLRKMEEFRIKLTNDLAHELRTPLAGIQAYVEAMHDGVLKPTPQNFGLVREEIERLNLLLTDLQKLAQAEKAVQRKDKVDLTEVTAKLLASLRILAEEKGINLKFIQSAPLYTLGDGRLLKTALQNVLVNAIKYTPAGGTVTVSLKAADKWVSVQISDTGIGIEAQELPLIFERFYRTDLSRSRKTGGTGIGLAITSQIVKAHGGEIDVQSEVGVGSTFTVRLRELSNE
ncbi:MAG TPA: HAMP domain-containing histidine kinase [Firmicutes bacterium]|nr:HAMP domain-containing histidine kinase [Bacillota bacterium]